MFEKIEKKKRENIFLKVAIERAVKNRKVITKNRDKFLELTLSGKEADKIRVKQIISILANNVHILEKHIDKIELIFSDLKNESRNHLINILKQEEKLREMINKYHIN